ncbi:IclR family transcriptional regulator [Haloarcula litorea]|uniref:IclR family transcriptional regulator n=1 Tax=Haloarcula litorea TaxID=3032579 RepID=UPI0023E784A0|nr:IclR family transcriptional regulator [Halomicroarcula sp. GDY20]
MSDYPVGATATTFGVVEALVERGEAGVTELADALDISKGAAHNHLTTLTRLGFAVREDGRYRLSAGFLDLGTRARERLTVYEAARGDVRRLARASGEVASLVVAEDGRAAYLLVRGDAADEIGHREGRRTPLHASAAGKAILAHLPDGEVDAFLDEHTLTPETAQTVTDAGALRDQLQTVRERGVAFDREEQTPGVRSVAAPLTGEDGTAVGAVSVAGPVDRMSGKRLEEDVTGLIVSRANSISVEIFSD